MKLSLLTEDQEFHAAVAIIKDGDKWLLGLSKHSDDRRNKWGFPGGGIRPGEDPLKAAEREAREEVGIRCKAKKGPFTVKDRPGVAFVLCTAQSKKIDTNHEFASADFFDRNGMKGLKLYSNVKDLITRAKRL